MLFTDEFSGRQRDRWGGGGMEEAPEDERSITCRNAPTFLKTGRFFFLKLGFKRQSSA